jgi:ATP-dependent DNA helicase RecG
MGLAIEYLAGSVKGAERTSVLEKLAAGHIDILVGTHALFSEDVTFKSFTMAVIDEQQKFGVLQRGRLRSKGDHPDCLVLTATPIPRTMSMTLYGDLDLSVIDELPPGRGGIETHIVKQAEVHRVYRKVREEVSEGRQAYFIYPLIEESSSSDLKNAVEAWEHFRKKVFPGLRVGLLHGRMSDQEKEEAMEAFNRGDVQVLVSTTVIEVGIDVPNATVMVIEQAERFGLSSIHQLRGRIGRGGNKSYCFLIPDRSTGRESFQRLKILKDTLDGFRIAEYDLELRGPGELLGKRQSGVPAFLIDDINITTKLIYRAQKDARRLVEGDAGTPGERKAFLDAFTRTEAYRNAMLFFGG